MDACCADPDAEKVKINEVLELNYIFLLLGGNDNFVNAIDVVTICN